MEALRLADEGGVNIAYGSDLLGGMRGWQSHEFSIRARVQSPGSILRSATTTAAKLLQSEGTSESSRRAPTRTLSFWTGTLSRMSQC